MKLNLSKNLARKASAILLSALLLTLYGCSQESNTSASATPCSPSWFEAVEAKVSTGDGQGHGPDVGSSEWRSVVEFRLGVRGDEAVPSSESQAWCDYIDALVFQSAQ